MTLENENFLTRFTKLEPAVWRGFLIALFALLALFGIEWATEANALTVLNVILAVLPILSGLFTRPAVTPNAKVGAEAAQDIPGAYEAGEAAPYTEGTPVDVVPDNAPDVYVEDRRVQDNDQEPPRDC